MSSGPTSRGSFRSPFALTRAPIVDLCTTFTFMRARARKSLMFNLPVHLDMPHTHTRWCPSLPLVLPSGVVVRVQQVLLHAKLCCKMPITAFANQMEEQLCACYSRWPPAALKSMRTQECGKSEENVKKPDSRMLFSQKKKRSILAQNYAVSEVHTTQRSDRQKGSPSSEHLGQQALDTRSTMSMLFFATAHCYTSTQPSGQWLPLSATWR